MISYSKSVIEKLKNLQENLSSKLDTFAHGYNTKSMVENDMSLTTVGAIGQATVGPSLTFTNTTTSSPWQSYPTTEPVNPKIHNFTCEQVENGWTLNYRGKSYIAPDIDSLMNQMKTVLVIERISK